MAAIGIDLGTTYSCVGVFKDGKIEIVANDQGNRTTPSWVSFKDGEKFVGDTAKTQAVSNFSNTIYNSKRLIGKNFDDPSIKNDLKNFTCKVLEKSNKPYFSVEHNKKELELSPEEVSSMVLVKMKEIAEGFLGTKVDKAVITVPAYFNDAQRQATKDAGKIAGLEVLRIINEPTAAALAYGVDKVSSKEKVVLVFDMGGGTHDVSLLSIEDGVFEVKATAGDSHLGGEDFDAFVTEYLIKDFQKKHGKSIKGNKRAMRKLSQASEKAKRTLSNATTATIEIDSLFEGIDYTAVLTRAKFEELCNSLFKKSMEPVEKVLVDSGTNKKDIDEVVLVGGSTRIPKIRDLLQTLFDGKELCKGVNPDECVAYGATVQAGVLTGCSTKNDILLLDVIPLSLGIETSGNIMTTLIPRNTPIPTKKTESFSTYSDNQPGATIVILEGERHYAKDNNVLGTFELSGIPPAKRGQPKINVSYDVDADGILNVSAEVENSGIKNSLTISNNRTPQAKIDEMLKNAEMFKAEDEMNREKNKELYNLESCLAGIKTQLETLRENNEDSSIDETEITELSNICEEIQTWLDSTPMSSTSKEDYVQKYTELQNKCMPILSKMHQPKTSSTQQQ